MTRAAGENNAIQGRSGINFDTFNRAIYNQISIRGSVLRMATGRRQMCMMSWRLHSIFALIRIPVCDHLRAEELQEGQYEMKRDGLHADSANFVNRSQGSRCVFII